MSNLKAAMEFTEVDVHMVEREAFEGKVASTKLAASSLSLRYFFRDAKRLAACMMSVGSISWLAMYRVSYVGLATRQKTMDCDRLVISKLKM